MPKKRGRCWGTVLPMRRKTEFRVYVVKEFRTDLGFG
jgi:hypothetical protein